MSGDRACCSTGNRDCLLCACVLTVCLGMGGRPAGLFVSASSLRMWSVLMYESYRPSPWRAKTRNKQTGMKCGIMGNLQQMHSGIRAEDDDQSQRQRIQNAI